MFKDAIWQNMHSGEVSMDGDVSRAVGAIDGTVEIKAAYVLTAADSASHATNYVTYNLINGGTDGDGTTVIATANTSATQIDAFKPFSLTITDANKEVTDGQSLIWERAEENTDAPADSNAVLHVRYIQTVSPS